MITIEVESNFREFTENVRQLPFATALALTRTAQEIQAEVRAELPQRFTIRNDWVSKGIRIEKATKQNLEATVYSKDAFMVLQETGGVKTSRGTAQGIPMDVKASARGIVPKGLWPRALLGNPKVFRARIGGVDGLWQHVRVSRKRRRAGERTLKLLYVLKPSVTLKPRFGFADTGSRIAAERWDRMFDLAWAEAVRTAR
jgi:hypothetical protein